MGLSKLLWIKRKNKKIPFFHLGADNDWKKILNQNYQYKLNFSFNKSMKELGYI